MLNINGNNRNSTWGAGSHIEPSPIPSPILTSINLASRIYTEVGPHMFLARPYPGAGVAHCMDMMEVLAANAYSPDQDTGNAILVALQKIRQKMSQKGLGDDYCHILNDALDMVIDTYVAHIYDATASDLKKKTSNVDETSSLPKEGLKIKTTFGNLNANLIRYIGGFVDDQSILETGKINKKQRMPCATER